MKDLFCCVCLLRCGYCTTFHQNRLPALEGSLVASSAVCCVLPCPLGVSRTQRVYIWFTWHADDVAQKRTFPALTDRDASLEFPKFRFKKKHPHIKLSLFIPGHVQQCSLLYKERRVYHSKTGKKRDKSSQITLWLTGAPLVVLVPGMMVYIY